MKRFFKLSVSLLLGTFLMFSMANAKIITIKGHVANLDGKPVANHSVTILSDSIYGNSYFHYRVVNTLADGSFIDTTNVPEKLLPMLHFTVWTQDCKNAYINKTFVFNGSPFYIADFRICDESYHFCNADFIFFRDSLPENTNYTVRFFDRSQGVNINKWKWNFGDSTPPSFEKDPQHSFGKPGEYRVCLNVQSVVNGQIVCENSICRMIYIKDAPEPPACKAAFVAFKDSMCIVYKFYDKSLGKGIVNWHWDFGDKTESFDKNPVHKFEKPGSYNVCLEISTPDSVQNPCKDRFCAMIYVMAPPQKDCKASFIVVKDSMDMSFHFVNKSIGTNKYNWFWDFGDNTFANDFETNHTYEKAGTYKVCLTMFALDSSCVNSFCGVVYVQGTPPPPQKYCKAYFYALRDSAKASFNFIDKSEAKNIKTWAWDFGDNNISDIQNPSHTYANPGAYKVCLTIKVELNDTSKCEDSYCFTVFVDSLMPPPPPNKGCMNYFTFKIGEKNDTTYTVDFVAFTKSDIPLVYEWNFGDGISMLTKENNVSHIYPKKGNYEVCLTTQPKNDSIKCSFTSCQKIFGIQDSTFAFGSMSGKIFADSNYADAGFVAVIRLNSNNTGDISYIDVAKIAEMGSYKFSNLPEGEYYVLAMLNPKSIYFKQFMPTFYGDVWKWQNAKVVTVAAKTETTNTDIHLKKMKPHKKGKCGFAGYIFDGYYKSAKNAPVSNVEVILFDNNDNPLEVTYSDNNGYYKFSEYDYGTYKLSIEVTGMETIAAVVSVDESNPSLENINFSVDMIKVLPLGDALYVTNNTVQSLNNYGMVYPNPVKDIASINIYAEKAAKINVAIYNQMGQLVLSNNLSLSAAAQTITVNTANLRKGVYVIKISEDNSPAAIRRFIKLD